MAGMFFTGNAVFTSIAAGMLMVGVALIGSLRPARAARGSGRASTADSVPARPGRPLVEGPGAFVLDVLRRPFSPRVLSAGFLLALAVPAFTMHTQLPSFTDLPKSLSIVRTYDSIQRAFPGAQTPAKVVITADDVTTPRVQQAYRRAEAACARERSDVRAGSRTVNPARTVARSTRARGQR